MRRQMAGALRISTAVLVLASYAGLSTIETFGLELLLLPVAILAAMPIFELTDSRLPVYRWLTQGCTLAFALIALPYLGLEYGPLPALTVLTVYIQAYLLLHIKTPREYQYIYLMSFFMLLAVCPQNPDPTLGLIIPVFLVSAVWALAILHVHSDIQSTGEVAVADLVPREATRLTSEDDHSGSLRFGLGTSLSAISAGVIIFTLAFFLLTPRMEAGLLGRSNNPLVRFTDVPDVVDLSQGGRITTDQSPVMHVRFPNEEGGTFNGELHWRVTTFNRFVGSRWDRRHLDELYYDDKPDGFSLSVGFRSELIRDSLHDRRKVVQSIYLDDPPSGGLPCLPMPLRLQSAQAQFRWSESGDLSVESVQAPNQAIAYLVQSELMDFSAEELRNAPTNFEEVMRTDYALLTFETLSPRSRALARELAQDATTPYDSAVAIRDWLLTEPTFFYSLDAVAPQGSDPIEAFLHQHRTGNCELYATAMALLLRSLGIPTRVATGYRGGEWNDGDGAYLVRKSMAHLWVEVYFIGIGWIAFDPTPASELEDLSPYGLVSRYLSRLMLDAKMVWFRDVVGYRGTINLGDLQDLSLALIEFDIGELINSPTGGRIYASVIPRIIIAMVLLIALIWIIADAKLRWRGLGTAKVVLTGDQQRAKRLYVALRQRLAKMGVPSHGLTAQELLVQASPLVAPADSIHEIVEEYLDARFGGGPLEHARFSELQKRIRRIGKTQNLEDPTASRPESIG